jgi:CheY-like chemotaxis protein
MTALLVILMFVGFVLLDALVRHVARRMQQTRLRREREAVLASAVRLEIADEARSLKRAEVHDPRARILAVDDEPVILDGLRKILVLDGFSVDTVESGPEALGLVQRRDYDFVYTDLKMPGMDGVEVVKAVKHLRPDVDVAVITGYGTIETAVETMQHGAVDYLQKPFSDDELTAFARRLLIKRQARIEAARRPSVRITTPAEASAAPAHDYCVPGGAFVAPGHVWMRIEPGGQVRLGLDDFARKALAPIDGVELPQPRQAVERQAPLFTLRRGEHRATFVAPLSGTVTAVNQDLRQDAGPLSLSPYDRGWICLIEPADLARALAGLRIGRPVVEWYQEELERLRQSRHAAGVSALSWDAFEREFLAPGVEAGR